MKKPELREPINFTHIDQYPAGTYFEAGYLTETNASWRVEKPIVDPSKCTHCLICYMHCPDGTIVKGDRVVEIDYDFCKGCGICKQVCPFKAIEMEEE